MPTVTFTPSDISSDVPENTKILVAAKKVKETIRFGCAACKCGTCAVKVVGRLSQIKPDEEGLLSV